MLGFAESFRKGSKGRKTSLKLLQKRIGLSPYNRNWRHRRGEIHLICLDKDCLVFIEVRLRKAISLVSGVHSISRSKKSLLRRSALAYLNRIQKHPKTYRFDIISIAYEQSKGCEISHYRNVALF